MPASASQHPQPASGPKKAPGREEVATLHPAAVRLGLAPGMRVPGGEGEQKESWPQLGLGTGLLGGFWRLPCHIPGTALLSVQGWGPRGINAVSALERGCTHFLLPQAIKDMNLSPVSPLLQFMPTRLQLSRGYNLAASGQIFTSSPGHTLGVKPSPRPSRRLLGVSCRKCSSFSSACSLHMAVLVWLACSSPRKAQVVSLAKLKADGRRALSLEAAGCLPYR